MAEARFKADMKVKEIMTKNPATLAPDDTVGIAEHVMKFGGIRHLPVVHDGRVVGVVSQRDLFRAAVTNYKETNGEASSRKNITAKELMSAPVITVSTEVDVREAARELMEKRIGCLPVLEGESLIGLITKTDILRYVVER